MKIFCLFSFSEAILKQVQTLSCSLLKQCDKNDKTEKVIYSASTWNNYCMNIIFYLSSIHVYHFLQHANPLSLTTRLHPPTKIPVLNDPLSVVSIGCFPAFYVVLVPLDYIQSIPPHSTYVIVYLWFNLPCAVRKAS